MDERKLRHDYINSIQTLKNFVFLVELGKLEAGSESRAALIEEAQRAVAFLEKEDLVKRMSPK